MSVTDEHVQFTLRYHYHVGKDAADDRKRTIDMARRYLYSGVEGSIICDIDETAIDNREYMAMLLDECKQFPYGWDNWCRSIRAAAAPEVWHLYAQTSDSVRWIFISSRDESLDVWTRYLIRREYGDVPPADIICAGDCKASRIAEIVQQESVALYLDDQILPAWGVTRLVFPNYVYGAHASALEAKQ
jgi:predicted secreted acid phosphatase